MIYFQCLKQILLWIKEKTFLECQSPFSFRWLFMSFFSWQCTADATYSAWYTNEYNCRLIFLEIWYKYQQQAAPYNAFITSPKHKISILAYADETSGTPLEGAATGPASITTKYNCHNKLKYLNIFHVINSEVTKSMAHFSVSAFKKTLLIFHPTCVCVC